MDVVLDSVVVSSMLRGEVAEELLDEELPCTCLDRFMRTGDLRAALDRDGGLLDEWRRTCDAEVIGVILTKWEELDGVVVVNGLGRIPPATGKRLRMLGFNDSMDRRIVRIALGTPDRRVSSTDTDFWDPDRSNRRAIGESNACVARLLRDELGVVVMTLMQLIAQLRG